MRILSGFLLSCSALFASLVFAACASSTLSTNVGTSGIWASFVVEQQSDTLIQARAYLRVGGSTGTIVDIASGEYISCNGATMSSGPLCYTAQFSAPATNGEYVFAFHRTDETVSTTVTVPAFPGSAAATPSASYNEWDPLTVSWDPSGTAPGDKIEIDITGDAIMDYSRTGIADSGSYTVNATDGTGVLSADNSTSGTSLLVSVRRYIVGSVNSEYQGGSTQAEHWSPAATVSGFQPRLTLEVLVSPSGSGTVSSIGSVTTGASIETYRRYRVGESVVLTAIPAEGWSFSSWSGDFTGTDNPRTISSISSNTNVTATFAAAGL